MAHAGLASAYTARVFALRLAALWPALFASAWAVSLVPTATLTRPGPAAVSGLAALPDGSRLLCLGSRVLHLQATGAATPLVRRAIALPSACLGLRASPSGNRVLVWTAAGLSVWSLSSGERLADGAAPDLRGEPGFLTEDVVVWGSASGPQTLNVQPLDVHPLEVHPLDLGRGVRQSLRAGAEAAGLGPSPLYVAPDGQRAVAGDGQRVALVRLPDFAVLSGMPCDDPCTLRGASFSADGRTATALAGRTLYSLRDGLPGNTLLRDTDAATGWPQPDNTVLTLSAAGAESRDLQTGRRERVLQVGGVQPFPAALAPGGRLTLLSTGGDLLDTDPEFRDVRRLPLPATLSGGGLDTGLDTAGLEPGGSGQVYTLAGNRLGLGSQVLDGTYWAVQTAGKTTVALRDVGKGARQLGLLSSQRFTPLPGLGTATHLGLNVWGNAAAVWDDHQLSVVALGSRKVVASLALPLAGAALTLSPDATRAFVVTQGAAYVVALPGGGRTPLPVSTAGAVTSVQVSGQGVQAIGNGLGQVSLYLPRQARPYATLSGQGEQARFSPDGRWLALPVGGGSGPRLDLIEVASGRVAARSALLGAQPAFVVWSPDSQRLSVGAGPLDRLSNVSSFELRQE